MPALDPVSPPTLRRYRREDLENELNRGALWAITYGDLMSYLMIFFLVLFSFSLGKGRKGIAPQKYEDSLVSIQRVFGGRADQGYVERLARRQREESVAQQLSRSMEDKRLSKYVSVTTSEEKVRLVLKEPVLFDSGRAELKPEADAILREIADAVKDMPNDIVIEGHTDNVPVRGGRYSSNWELSMARAYAVIRFFEGAGIDPKRLSGVGYGEHRPSADNSTSEGRAQNRRIGINLLRGQ